MAGGRRNLQRRGGRANRDTRLPINRDSNSHNSEEDRCQSPQGNHPPNSPPNSANEQRHNEAINNSQVDATLQNNHPQNPSPQSASNEPGQNGESSMISTHKRSAYRGQALERENNRRKGKMVVEFGQSGKRPLIADQSAKLASEMGKACRDLLPLHIDDWRTFRRSEKQRAWERVKNRLDIDNIVKDADMFQAADRWMGNIHRNHRSKTKRKWIKIGDVARPNGSNDEDWKKITEHWAREMEEERAILQSQEPSEKRTKSMIGKDARSKVKYLHRAGSRSFESRRNEQINKTRQLPNAIEFFKLTRYCDARPDGTGGWVSQQAAEDYGKMVKMYEESQASDKPETLEEIVDKFMNADKRSDYHPGRGYGPPSVGRSSRRQVRMRELEVTLEETQANLREERVLREQQSE